jgi:hypothetical protein
MAHSKHTLAEAYAQTLYEADCFRSPLRANEPHAEVDALLLNHHAKTMAFITASNPRSLLLSATENKTRNSQLSEKLADYKTYRGVGRDARGEWTPEESFLVIGIEKQTALALAEAFEQNAILFGEIGKPVELLFTRVFDALKK